MTSKELYVWVYLENDYEPTLAGKHVISYEPASGVVGSFVYAKSYLSNPNAFSIDPVSMPLSDKVLNFTKLNGYPSALLDTCPDSWGIKVINRLYGAQHFPDGYLLMNDGGRVGALGFSEDKDTSPVEVVSRAFELSELLSAALALEADKPVHDELLIALLPGTGGARPKCTVVYDDATWIAKFPSIKDVGVSSARLEHATMQLAKLCGIDVAETNIIKVGDHDVCLVKRFERIHDSGRVSRRHYISGRTVFSAEPQYANLGSYQRLAKWLPRYVSNAADSQKELYRRMVFNVAVRNSDDHELNHGLLHVTGNEYVLSKAFDVLPTISKTLIPRHALLIGDSGAGTKENLLGIAKNFNLTLDEATSIIEKIEATIKSNFHDVFYAAGFGDEDIRLIEAFFSEIPLNSEKNGDGNKYRR